MSFRDRLASLTRGQKIALSLALAVSVYGAFGFLALPPLARNVALESLRETFARDATVGDVRINPFLLTLDVDRFVLPDRDGSPFVHFDSLHADFELSSIVHGAFTFRELRLARPFVHVKILESGELNFADMLEVALAEDDAEPAADAEEEGAPPVLVQLASIEAGRILFSDLSRPTDFEHEISPLDIEVRDFGTRPDDESPYSFKATTGAGESLEWEGSISAIPFYSKGRLALTGVRPRTGWLYVQDDVFFEVVDGTIDVEARYEVDAREGLVLRLEEGEIRVRDFAVADRETGENAMSIASVDVQGIEVAYPEQTLRVASLRSRGGRHHALRLEDGQPRIQQLARTRGEAAPGEGAPAPPAGATEGPPAPSTPSAESAPWSIVVDEIEIAEHRIDFEDRSTTPPVAVTLAPITLRLTDVRGDPTHPIRTHLDLAVGEGRITIDGPVRAEPPHLELDVAIEALDLRAFEPYWLPFADVDLTSGRFGAGGRLVASAPADGPPRVEWTGDLRIDALRTLDRTLRSSLVAWSALELSSLALDSAGPSVSLERLRLIEPTAHFMVASDGTTNFSHVAVEGDDPPDRAPNAGGDGDATPGPAPQVSVARVEIVGGAATFEDRSVSPRFETGVTRLEGSVSGLSSDRAARARVDLAGRLAGATPVRIEGEVSPLADETYLDLRLAFENFELSPLTPYSGRHIGQTIARGKLFLDVEYVLDGSRIRGENELLIDQLTLGERVQSDEALNLPVGLAIALLKDRNGEIRIDLPVKGDVDDPEFSIGKLVFGALGNLVTKVALSPFAMLGGIGGGDDDATRAVEFAHGRASLAVAEASQLDALAGALADRPALSLELTGTASAALDGPVLQADALDVELRRERLRELQGRWFGEKPETIDDVVLEPKDRRRLLERRYETVFGEAPVEGQVPPVDALPVADVAAGRDANVAAAWLDTLERRLAGVIEVDEGALRALAARRSQVVRDYMIEQGGVPAERIYTLDVSIDGQDADAATVLSLAAH